MIITKKVKTLRLYPLDTIINDRTQEMVDTRRALVAVGPSISASIPLDQVVGVIESLDVITRDGVAEIIATINIANTEFTRRIEPFLNELDLTPVGVGSVKENVVQSDYKLTYFSLVKQEDDYGGFSEEEPEEGASQAP